MKITVLGGGAWGTAVANVLASNDKIVSLWCRETETVACIKSTSINSQFLPGVQLDKKVVPTNSLEEALKDSDWVFAAVPVKFFRTVLEQGKQCVNPETNWVLLNKGIEQGTLLFPSQIVIEIFGIETTTVVLAGASFAKELAEQQLTGIVAAGNFHKVQELKNYLDNDYFIVEPSDDKIGVELCAAVKTVITVGMGILNGGGYGENTKAFFLVKSLSEIKTLVETYGGNRETVDGYSGIGDLVMSAFGSQSRNLAVGYRLGQGDVLEDILAETSTVPEGTSTTVSIQQLIEQKNLELPLFTGIYKMIYQKLSVVDFVKIMTI